MEEFEKKNPEKTVPLKTVDVQMKAAKLLDLYRDSFQERFTEAPFVDVGDAMEHCKWLTTNIGYDKSCAIITAYFRIKDDWITGQGYSLEWMKNNINRIITMAGLDNKKNLPVYVVSLTASGFPVCSHNRFEMGKDHWFKSVTQESWLKLPTEKKIQYPRHKFIHDDVEQWISNWKECGWSC